MVITPHKQINIRLLTTKRLDQLKLVNTESYDSILTRILDEIDEIKRE